MAPSFQKQLQRYGKMLSAWNAELKGTFWSAAILASLALFCVSDVFIRFTRFGRISLWTILIALVVLAFRQVGKAAAKSYTLQGVAAAIERAFPQLDNHLINFVQFSMSSDDDPFKKAYVEQEAPPWRQVDLKQMKDRKSHMKAKAVLGLSLFLLGGPFLFAQKTWGVSLWRIINPFASITPVSFTHILDVNPGDSQVLQGGPLILTCKVQGMKGHSVWLDINPTDNERTTILVGKIADSNPQEFHHRLSQVNTQLKYRFRAGDAPFPKWYSIDTRPPLAFSKIELEVIPPDYTGFRRRTFDGISEQIEIPQGSVVNIQVECNQDLSALNGLLGGGKSIEFQAGKKATGWSGSVTVQEGAMIRLDAFNTFKEKAEAAFNFQLIPDKVPIIEILLPKARTYLAPGTVPQIQFSVTDDYELGDIRIERIPVGNETSGKGALSVASFKPGRTKEFFSFWRGDDQRSEAGQPMVFRVTAMDSYPLEKRVSRSQTVIFDTTTAQEAIKKESEAQAKATTTLGRVIELQKKNLDRTRSLRKALDAAGPEHWSEAREQQMAIRELTRQILASPSKPLGNLTTSIQKLYAGEMEDVIRELQQVSKLEGLEKEISADKSIVLEEKILRRLDSGEVAAKRTETQRKISGLMTMVDALIKKESKILEETGRYITINAKAGESLVDQQDGLASDVSEFVNACNLEAPVLEATDPAFAELIQKVAVECQNRSIRSDMLLAAAKLEKNVLKEAVPLQQRALTNLKELQNMMNEMRTANAEQELEKILETLREANDKMEKIKDLEAKAIEAMAQIKATSNEDEKETDLLEEELAEIRENTKESLLEIARDLHIFPELEAANELVEDCISVFAEVAAKNEDPAAGGTMGEVKEVATLKPEQAIEAMKKAQGQMDGMEMWLATETDKAARLQEAFDVEELPVMPLGALSTQMEDLIGDLLEQQEEEAKKADDSATNLAMSDLAEGWEAAEGETASFGAKGKSGNTEPDHKEQSGRSNIGRQGMSSGETAAGSGTIGEGDKNIEERMTTDPQMSGQVQADGEADTVATGGGKQGDGGADGYGMSGSGQRRDSTAQGSEKDLQALLAGQAEALTIKASLLNIRTDSLATAAHHMWQANDAIARGMPINQVKEFQKRAVVDLKRALTEVNGGVSGSVDAEGEVAALENLIEGGTDEAPATYRGMVSEYFKSLNESI